MYILRIFLFSDLCGLKFEDNFQFCDLSYIAKKIGGGGHVEGVIYIGVILCRGLSCGHLLRIFSLALETTVMTMTLTTNDELIQK